MSLADLAATSNHTRSGITKSRMRAQASALFCDKSHWRESAMPHAGLGTCTSSGQTRPPATCNSLSRLPPHSTSIWLTMEPVLHADVMLSAIRAMPLNKTQRRRWSPRKASLKALNNARRSTDCTLGIFSAARSAVWCAVRGKRSADLKAVACHDSRRATSVEVKKHSAQPYNMAGDTTMRQR